MTLPAPRGEVGLYLTLAGTMPANAHSSSLWRTIFDNMAPADSPRGGSVTLEVAAPDREVPATECVARLCCFREQTSKGHSAVAELAVDVQRSNVWSIAEVS